MGRWRPPSKSGSPYITAAGFSRLEDELTDLWLRRGEVVKALSDAAAEGDRSENAEYIYRKKELGSIDRRIRYLQKRIPTLKIIRHEKAHERVFFGARVRVSINNGDDVCYRIVGEDEADAGKGDINIDSPLGKALLKKEIGDEVQVRTAESVSIVRINSIDYDTEE